MKVIWKYEIKVDDTFRLYMPKGSKVLTVQVQRGVPYLWAEVEQPVIEEPPQKVAEKPDEKIYHCYETGHPIEETNLQYIGTFQLRGGALVFHLYEKI